MLVTVIQRYCRVCTYTHMCYNISMPCSSTRLQADSRAIACHSGTGQASQRGVSECVDRAQGHPRLHLQVWTGHRQSKHPRLTTPTWYHTYILYLIPICLKSDKSQCAGYVDLHLCPPPLPIIPACIRGTPGVYACFDLDILYAVPLLGLWNDVIGKPHYSGEVCTPLVPVVKKRWLIYYNNIRKTKYLRL